MARLAQKRVTAVLILAALLLTVAAACGGRSTTPTATPTGQPIVEPTPTPEPTSRDMAAYFSGKTITFLVGFAPGGGYDIFARLLALHWPKYIPGSPSIVVQNMPGAGGLRGLQALVQAEPDGFSIGYAHPRFINQDLLYGDVENFTVDDIIPVGVPSSTESTYLYFVRRDVATSLEQVLSRSEPLIMGQTEPVGPGYPSNAIWERLGVPLRIVYGWGGTTEIAAGLDRGELQVGYRIPSTMHLYPRWVSERMWVPIFYNGAHPSVDEQVMEYLRLTDQEADIPPHIYEALNVPPDLQEYMDLGLNMFLSFSRMVILPADTPADIVRTIRDSFREVVHDPEFIAAAELAGEQVGYVSPERLEELIAQARQILSDPQRLQEFLALGD